LKLDRFDSQKTLRDELLSRAVMAIVIWRSFSRLKMGNFEGQILIYINIIIIIRARSPGLRPWGRAGCGGAPSPRCPESTPRPGKKLRKATLGRQSGGQTPDVGLTRAPRCAVRGRVLQYGWLRAESAHSPHVGEVGKKYHYHLMPIRSQLTNHAAAVRRFPKKLLARSAFGP